MKLYGDDTGVKTFVVAVVVGVGALPLLGRRAAAERTEKKLPAWRRRYRRRTRVGERYKSASATGGFIPFCNQSRRRQYTLKSVAPELYFIRCW